MGTKSSLTILLWGRSSAEKNRSTTDFENISEKEGNTYFRNVSKCLTSQSVHTISQDSVSFMNIAEINTTRKN